jgi:hypothetical protein
VYLLLMQLLQLLQLLKLLKLLCVYLLLLQLLLCVYLLLRFQPRLEILMPPFTLLLLLIVLNLRCQHRL